MSKPTLLVLSMLMIVPWSAPAAQALGGTELTLPICIQITCFDWRLRPSINTRASPSQTSHVHHGSAALKDYAFLSGPSSLPKPTGTVRFYLCGPMSAPLGCPSGGTYAGSATLSNGQAVSPSLWISASFGPSYFCWRVEYGGDLLYRPASHTNGDTECTRVLVYPA